jgi:hypothetical protein
MKKIEYAKMMTKDECDKFMQFLIDKNKNARELSCKLINDNKDEIINLYKSYCDRTLSEFNQAVIEYHKKTKAYEDNVCYVCGSKMRYISGYDFWGCPNYKQGDVSHSTYKGFNPAYFPSEPNYKGWTTKMILNTRYKGLIKSIDLYNFIVNEMKLEDLSLQEKKYINNYMMTKESTTDFEKTTYKKIKLEYDNVLYQPGFVYRYEREKDKMCFMDILASNKIEVVIYECKSNRYEVNDNQKSLYINILQYLLNKANDKRIIKFEYVFENNR